MVISNVVAAMKRSVIEGIGAKQLRVSRLTRITLRFIQATYAGEAFQCRRSYGFLQGLSPILVGSNGWLEVQTAKAMRSSFLAMITMASVVAKPFALRAR